MNACIRLPRGTPVSPAMKTPPKNHAEEGEAENRLPLASATFTVVVSGEPDRKESRVMEPTAATDAEPDTSRLILRLGVSTPELGSSFHGSPGRIVLFAAEGSMSFLRSAA